MSFTIDFGSINPFTGPLAFTSGWLMGRKGSQAQQNAIDYQDRASMYSQIGQGLGQGVSNLAYYGVVQPGLVEQQGQQERNSYNNQLAYQKALQPILAGSRQMGGAGSMGMSPDQMRTFGAGMLESLGPEKGEAYTQAYLGRPYAEVMKAKGTDEWGPMTQAFGHMYGQQFSSQMQHPGAYPYQNAQLPGGPMAAGMQPNISGAQPPPLPFGDDAIGHVATGLMGGQITSTPANMQPFNEAVKQWQQERAPYVSSGPPTEGDGGRLSAIDNEFAGRLRDIAARIPPNMLQTTQKPDPFSVMSKVLPNGGVLTMGGMRYHAPDKATTEAKNAKMQGADSGEGIKYDPDTGIPYTVHGNSVHMEKNPYLPDAKEIADARAQIADDEFYKQASFQEREDGVRTILVHNALMKAAVAKSIAGEAQQGRAGRKVTQAVQQVQQVQQQAKQAQIAQIAQTPQGQAWIKQQADRLMAEPSGGQARKPSKSEFEGIEATVPPPGQRVPGRIYPTPAGPRRWNADGKWYKVTLEGQTSAR